MPRNGTRVGGGLGAYYGGPGVDGAEGTEVDLFSNHTGGDPFARPEDTTNPSTPASSPPDGLNPLLIPDGFAYNVRMKRLPYRSHVMQLRLLDQYRRQALSGAWQPRMYVAPQDVSVPIAGGDTIYYEQRVARGAVLWGFSFAILAPGALTDIGISLLDKCNMYEITAGARSVQFIGASAFRANLTVGTPSAGFPFVFASEPYRVSGPGLIEVAMVNKNSAANTAQLLMLFLEPGGVPA